MRRYLRDLDGCDADDVYEIVLREMEIPLFVEVLNHCEGNQSRAAAMLGIHRATLRKKLKDYGISAKTRTGSAGRWPATPRTVAGCCSCRPAAGTTGRSAPCVDGSRQNQPPPPAFQ